MKKKLTFKSCAVIGLLILCLVVSVIGCSSKTTDHKTIFSGVNNSIKVGDSFQVVLKGNLSTGYDWYYAFDKNGIIKLLSKIEVQDKKNVPGSGSTFTWNFKALKVGNVKLLYKYFRGSEGEASAKKENTILYQITVTK